MKHIVILIAWLAMLIGLYGCKSCEPMKVTEYRDSVVTRNVLDSVYVYEKDSVSIREKNDTVFFTKYSIRYKDKLLEKTDTVYVDRRVEKVNHVKYVPKIYKWAMYISVTFLLILVIIVVYKIYKLFVFHI